MTAHTHHRLSSFPAIFPTCDEPVTIDIAEATPVMRGELLRLCYLLFLGLACSIEMTALVCFYSRPHHHGHSVRVTLLSLLPALDWFHVGVQQHHKTLN